MEYAIAVFDVGKTNKKLIIFDDKLNPLDSSYRNFTPYEAEGGRFEPVEEMEEWLLNGLSEAAKKYPIRCISVTTHGAGSVCVGDDGKPSIPPIDYTYEPGEEFHKEFYELAGDKHDLQRETATLELKSLINPAKAIYYLKKTFPEKFKRTINILLFPQYFGFRLTGNVAVDYTYAGCHTYLWDFSRMQWSKVADALGIRSLLPEEIKHPWEVLGSLKNEIAERTGLPSETLVTLGIHDSNASLLPYLLKMKKDFVLNSTGTWCVDMHPMDKVFFTDDEIGKSVFYNLSAFAGPVKTTILMGGLEFETYTEILKKIHGRDDFPPFSEDSYRRIVKDKEHFILPGVAQGSGQFPNSKPRIVSGDHVFALAEIQEGKRVPDFFNDYELAYAVLNLSLAAQTKVGLERVGLKEGIPVFTEGGFRNNPDYMSLLSAFFPKSKQFISNLKEATSFGAAMLGKVAVEKIDPYDLKKEISIDTQEIVPCKIHELGDYFDKFISLV